MKVGLASSGFDRYERLKVLLLSTTFMLVVAAYTVVYDLKNSVFMSIVGKEYVPWAKMGAMVALIPAVLFYSMLVDHIRRYQLLVFYSCVYGVLGLLFAYFIGHPTIGLPNTDTSPYRIFGWLFFFVVEGFSPFMVSVFWAFANSVSSPEGAKNNYAMVVTGSKIGGMLSAGFSCLLLSACMSGRWCFTDATNHQLLLLFFSFVVLMVPPMIYLLMKVVPGRYLHGYEAVYKFEKKKKKESGEESLGLFAGLRMLLERPYIFGIFCMVFFYEVLNAVLSYQRLGVAKNTADTVSGVSLYLYQQMFLMHFIGFFISIIGTRTLLRKLGEQYCLILIPLSSGILVAYFLGTYTPVALTWVFVILKSINYGFAQPVRESLYIPTVKDVKFKSKSWIDAFGSKMARGFGSLFNIFAGFAGSSLFFPLHAGFFMILIGTWFGAALKLGARYTRAIKNNEVIE